MKIFILGFVILISSLVQSDTYVNGYYRKDGTYVNGHYRSNPNASKGDNWSTKGNINPYTGSRGTKDYDNYNNDRNLYRVKRYPGSY
jgi:hypothetical protein